MEGSEHNGKIRKKAKSHERYDQELLQEREADRKSLRPRLSQAYADGLGPTRRRTAKAREASQKSRGTTQGSQAEDISSRGHVINKKFVKHLVDKYQAHDVTGDGKKETFCNFFINDVALKAGCEDFLGKDWPLLANDIVEFMETNTESWQELDCDEAQIEANFGHLVVAGAYGKRHGHVALVIQGTLTWSKQFMDDVPNSANVGQTNFYGKPISYAFKKDMPPRYFKWLGARRET